jgi:hypothetical protein
MVLFGVLGGCHHGGDPAGPEACERTVAAYCQKGATCYPESLQRGGVTLEECQAEDLTACRQLGALNGANPHAYERWDACNAALVALSCDQLRSGGDFEACRPLPGTRKTGETCVDSSQCEGLSCEPISSPMPGQQSCGRCAVEGKLAVGASCQDSAECRDGYCDNKKCVAFPGEGGACDMTYGCRGAFLCLDGTCRKPLTLGATCASDEQCGFGAACPNGTCQLVAMAGVGMPCSDDVICRGNTRCDGATMICVPLKHLGESCSSDDDCSALWLPVSCQSGHCAVVTEAMCPAH